MKALAECLNAVASAPHRTAREAHLTDYFAGLPMKEQGWALGWMLGALTVKRRSAIWWRRHAETRIDPVLFDISAKAIGDVGETVALVWPGGGNMSISEVLETVNRPEALITALDQLDTEGRVALIRLCMGRKPSGIRFAEMRDSFAVVHGAENMVVGGAIARLSPPYDGLFHWLNGEADEPQPAPQPPEVIEVAPDAAPAGELADYIVRPLPDGEIVAISGRRLFDCDGAPRGQLDAEDGWGFLNSGEVIRPEDTRALSGDWHELRQMHGALLLRDQNGQHLIWRAKGKRVICPVGFIEIGRDVSLTLLVNQGGAPAPLAKLTVDQANAAKVAAFARREMVAKFGPVREVKPGLWAELSYNGFAPAPRRKIGVTPHTPRLTALQWGEGPRMPLLAELIDDDDA